MLSISTDATIITLSHFAEKSCLDLRHSKLLDLELVNFVVLHVWPCFAVNKIVQSHKHLDFQAVPCL